MIILCYVATGEQKMTQSLATTMATVNQEDLVSDAAIMTLDNIPMCAI